MLQKLAAFGQESVDFPLEKWVKQCEQCESSQDASTSSNCVSVARICAVLLNDGFRPHEPQVIETPNRPAVWLPARQEGAKSSKRPWLVAGQTSAVVFGIRISDLGFAGASSVQQLRPLIAVRGAKNNLVYSSQNEAFGVVVFASDGELRQTTKANQLSMLKAGEVAYFSLAMPLVSIGATSKGRLEISFEVTDPATRARKIVRADHYNVLLLPAE